MLTFPRKVDFFFLINFNYIYQKFSMLLYRTQTQSLTTRDVKFFHIKSLPQLEILSKV